MILVLDNHKRFDLTTFFIKIMPSTLLPLHPTTVARLVQWGGGSGVAGEAGWQGGQGVGREYLST